MKTVERETSVIRSRPWGLGREGMRYTIEEMTELSMLTLKLD